MGIWHKLVNVFKKEDPIKKGWYKRIIAVRGEESPGTLSLDLGTFNELGEVVPVETLKVELKITPELRPTANRILAGVHTEEDEQVIELIVLNQLK